MHPALKRLPLLAAVATLGAEAQPRAPDLLDLSIEELANLRITSVSRVEERLNDAPAAVFVITAEDIRRSGVTSIPEALRLAPGVEVARRSTHAWSITMRGFNGDLANKLLVLIDGRSVYSPLYAGVFWDVQDVLLEDVDRIEVVSGPGGTLWGANAVNGVVNVITRSAADTLGGLAEIGGGNEESAIAGLRYGGTIGESAAARVYLKYLDRDASAKVTGADAFDGLRIARMGFRIDSQSERPDRWTLQGDVYRGDKDGEFLDAFTLGTLPAENIRDQVEMAGANLLGRWDRRLSDASDLSLQMYYDHTERDIPNTYDETRDTLDVDFQHRFRIGRRNDFLWGAGWRRTRDELENSQFASFEPERRSDQTISLFIQDEIVLRAERLFLTLGSKFEHNDYTGVESQPNVRLTWLIDERRTFWSAISRAVRIPSRLDADLSLTVPIAVPTIPFPVYVNVRGSDEFDSEELVAYEAGYRVHLGDALSLDVSVFRHDYDRLQTTEPRTPVLVLVPPAPYATLPNVLENGMAGDSTGGTLVANWQPLSAWRLRFQYTYLDLALDLDASSQDVAATRIAGNSPEHQLAVHAFVDLPRDLSFYAGIRYVDELSNQAIDNYSAVDVNLNWKPRDNLQTSITVQNLNDDRHAEFAFGSGNQIQRSAMLKLSWLF